uniref:Uncharacterized protein n=1 Tax=Arundo donax TaxID=35708 RepID=A0A0A8Y8M0_ARUDO
MVVGKFSLIQSS